MEKRPRNVWTRFLRVDFVRSYEFCSGLGAGTSANAFIRHGISTTIVEIDPAVYGAARKWFGLPDPGPGKVFIEDARVWAASQEAKKEGDLYDVVIHDCFSGGGVPEHIFTVEFWNDLKAVMAPDAVFVVVSPHFDVLSC